MENIVRFNLFVIKFCINNVLYNFFVEHILEKIAENKLISQKIAKILTFPLKIHIFAASCLQNLFFSKPEAERSGLSKNQFFYH